MLILIIIVARLYLKQQCEYSNECASKCNGCVAVQTTVVSHRVCESVFHIYNKFFFSLKNEKDGIWAKLDRFFHITETLCFIIQNRPLWSQFNGV